MNRNQSVKYDPTIVDIRTDNLNYLGHRIDSTLMKRMQPHKTIRSILAKHPLLSKIDWSNNNIVLAGGYVSRLLCNDSVKDADLDLFLYGDYSKSDLRRITYLISSTYDRITWYRTGCVLVADTPDVQIQIMCTNHKTKSDVIDVFDATYVQCGWDGASIFVMPDFNKYTPHAIAVVTRPTCSIWRTDKAFNRGFALCTYDDQEIMWVVKNPMKLDSMQDFPLEKCLTEVNIHGDFNPYIETSYYHMKDSKYERCMVTVEIIGSLLSHKSILIREYLAYKLILNSNESIQHIRIVADDIHLSDVQPVTSVMISIDDSKYSIPSDQLEKFKL